jgi:choline dehydrogenase
MPGSSNHKNPLADDPNRFSFICVPLQPASKGMVRLVSSDPRVRPACDLGTLSNSADMIPMRAAVRLAIALANQMQRQGYSLRPVEVPTSDSDEDIDAFVRRTVTSTFHYASSCRIGAAEVAVVDARLRVHGVRGLRIADASVFPRIPAAHLQAPVVMVAERCADFIAEDNVAHSLAVMITELTAPSQ